MREPYGKAVAPRTGPAPWRCVRKDVFQALAGVLGGCASGDYYRGRALLAPAGGSCCGTYRNRPWARALRDVRRNSIPDNMLVSSRRV